METVISSPQEELCNPLILSEPHFVPERREDGAQVLSKLSTTTCQAGEQTAPSH